MEVRMQAFPEGGAANPESCVRQSQELKFAYDAETLAFVMGKNGFEKIQQQAYQQSALPELAIDPVFFPCRGGLRLNGLWLDLGGSRREGKSLTRHYRHYLCVHHDHVGALVELSIHGFVNFS